MHRFKKNIDQQIEYNKGKNLFHDNAELAFGFYVETINAFTNNAEITREKENELIDYATNKAIEEFCRINQYFSFSIEDKNTLRGIYATLLKEIVANEKPMETISKDHYRRLKLWLRNSNPFAEKLYSNGKLRLHAVACSEYSAEIQIEMLHISISEMKEPVLDIGCGTQGNLVKYLRTAGFEAFGIDRFASPDTFLANADWLTYDYGVKKWGTMISNLGFSNHFHHHHLRHDGDFALYAKKYMEILHALKTGGSFHYAPGLPFIEKFLDKNQFQITSQPLGIEHLSSVIVQRIC